jgi:hypothetical protein
MQQSRFPSAVCAPSVAQAGARPPEQYHASMANYQTTDHMEEINCHRGGEDSCTTIKRNRERH